MPSGDDELERIGRLKRRLDRVLAHARGIRVEVPLGDIDASTRDLLLLAELYRRDGVSALRRSGRLVLDPPVQLPWWRRWPLAIRWLFARRAVPKASADDELPATTARDWPPRRRDGALRDGPRGPAR